MHSKVSDQCPKAHLEIWIRFDFTQLNPKALKRITKLSPPESASIPRSASACCDSTTRLFCVLRCKKNNAHEVFNGG